MLPPLSSRHILALATLLLGLSILAPGQQAGGEPEGKEKERKVRFICVDSLVEDQEVILASMDDKGGWQERGTTTLRSSFVTDWVSAPAGKLHLALRVDGSLKSICSFNYPPAARRLLVVLIPDRQNQVYRASAIDPEKLEFVKGSALVTNFSRTPGAIMLGSAKDTVNSGTSKVIKPVPEANGMYRMVAAYFGEDKKPVPCYDRYVPFNKDAREMIFLLPDPKLGLKVFSLSEFGPFD